MMESEIEIETKERAETFQMDEVVVMVMERDVDCDYVRDLGRDERVGHCLVRVSVLCFAVVFWIPWSDSHHHLCLAHVRDLRRDAVYYCWWIVCFRHLGQCCLFGILFLNLGATDACLLYPSHLIPPICF